MVWRVEGKREEDRMASNEESATPKTQRKETVRRALGGEGDAGGSGTPKGTPRTPKIPVSPKAPTEVVGTLETRQKAFKSKVAANRGVA